jgi:hypothetical protein
MMYPTKSDEKVLFVETLVAMPEVMHAEALVVSAAERVVGHRVLEVPTL